MGHSGVEHRLRSDIEERHSLKNEIRKKQSLIDKLSQKIEKTKKKRLNNRYSATVMRYNEELEMLVRDLREMNLDLKKRIADEMDFSEQEVQEYREQYQKELAELKKTEGKLEEIEAEEPEAEENAEEESEEKSVPKEAMVARTRRMLNMERRTLEEIQKELSSEERDKVFFSNELQQIIAELEADGEN